jgi:formylglycine-generating enzyme required for sulfatase activity
MALAFPASAAITQTLHVQGFLTDKNTRLPVDKAKDMRFLVCDSAAGDCSAPLFSETRCASANKAVPVVKGRYDAEVGSSTAGGIPSFVTQDRSALWIEVQVDPNDLCGPFTPLFPRLRVDSSAFAFEALHASTAGAADAAFRADTIAGLPATAYGGVAVSTNLFILGSLGAGTTAPASTLDVNGSARFGTGAIRSVFSASGVLTLPADPASALQAATKQYADSWDLPCENPNDANDVMVPAGPWCVDKYEASAWSTATGGTQYGASSDDYPCNDNGQNCSTAGSMIYARSVVGVTPSRYLTWFQAQAACANSGKELLPNSVWQQAAIGTPDPGAGGTTPNCKTSGSGPAATGADTNCLSSYGLMDRIGSLWEWVADWGSYVQTSGTWMSVDYAWASAGGVGPNALVRGGRWDAGSSAGVFAFAAGDGPSSVHYGVGFRCGRRR